MAIETETIEVACCSNCPFFDESYDTCEHASGYEFDGGQDYDDEPPDWCPLRGKRVLVVLDGVS